MSTVAFVGSKGGTLKTGCALSVSALLAAAGLRVVLVDCDPQASSTEALPEAAASRGSGAVAAWRAVRRPLTAPLVPVPLAAVAAGGGALWLARSGPLATARAEAIADHVRRAHAGVDVVVVDTLPVMGDVVTGVVQAADVVVVPTEATFDAAGALARTMLHVETAAPRALRRVVLTRMPRPGAGGRFVGDVRAMMATTWAGHLYPVEIPAAVVGAEANASRTPAALYRPRHALAAAYRALALAISDDLDVAVPALAAQVAADSAGAARRRAARGAARPHSALATV